MPIGKISIRNSEKTMKKILLSVVAILALLQAGSLRAAQLTVSNNQTPGGKWFILVIACETPPQLEAFQSLAKTHRKLNELNRSYVSGKETVRMLQQQGRYDEASVLLGQLRKALEISQQGRQAADNGMLSLIQTQNPVYGKSHTARSLNLTLPAGRYIVYLQQTLSGGMLVAAAVHDITLAENDRKFLNFVPNQEVQ